MAQYLLAAVSCHRSYSKLTFRFLPISSYQQSTIFQRAMKQQSTKGETTGNN